MYIRVTVFVCAHTQGASRKAFTGENEGMTADKEYLHKTDLRLAVWDTTSKVSAACLCFIKRETVRKGERETISFSELICVSSCIFMFLSIQTVTGPLRPTAAISLWQGYHE